ncbi:putative DNA mismatch repair protein MutL [Candidatus Zixiibacteriota bacterium]|nr:putative DNA mismatch repair protein MutL [candidate division Zixibacteria bacterium]
MTNSRSPEVSQRWIKPLPERLINKIAAGEVIERPAAVLKELVENSLDAGATKIDIIVEKSGTKSITILDNGCGIPAEQMEIAFSRHATSKIRDFSDLENLTSFGFRGEALPSIASISKTRMVSRTAEADSGTEIIIEGGVVQSLKPVAAPPGTKIEVGELFFNTPARRKFLKAEVTEARHLTRNAVALALSAPSARFSYSLNGRAIYSVDDDSNNMKRRAGRLLLGEKYERLLEITSIGENIEITGFVSYPDQGRQNQYGLFLFINNRYIKSQSLTHAVISGYGELLPRGNYPLGAVFLKIDPVRVDVNVHPTKAEVRLSEETLVHDILHHAVKQALRQSGALGPAVITSTAARPESQWSAREAIRRIVDFSPHPPIPSQTALNELYGRQESGMPPKPNPIEDENPLSGIDLITEKPPVEYPGGVSFLGQFAELYLVFRDLDTITIMDQHAAHERILYEENLRLMNSGGGISQSLLFPVTVELSPERYLLFEESANYLNKVGFLAEPFGANAVLISTVPVALSRKSPEKIFESVLDDIDSIRAAGADLIKAVAQSLACRSAVMAGDRLGPDEAMALWRQLMNTENKHCCPHGRPTFLTISRNELDVKFGRK